MNPEVFPPTSEELGERLAELLAEARDAGLPFDVYTIGASREGRPLYAVAAGEGPVRVSITAGAHSDEPGGPLAAMTLIRWLLRDQEGRGWLARAAWRICPHVNPDGAERNAAWFREPPDIETYAHHVFREPPGEDVEFNYPAENQGRPARPENQAAASFLRSGGPYHLHFSLHGMAYAEGAWWLIGKDWVDRTKGLRERLASLFARKEWGVHDIERRGEKGFTRIERGFSTTPTSTAMREFFLGENDPETAQLFLPSSMEFVQSLGGDPLVMVSELPIFRLHGGGEIPDPPGQDTPFLSFRGRLKEAQKQLQSGNSEPLRDLVREFDVRPVSFAKQAETLVEAVIAAAQFIEEKQLS